uniref:hypothetical protein n=1 Tax=Prevotella sp. TaxID=59823 RepID=UPI00402A23FB
TQKYSTIRIKRNQNPNATHARNANDKKTKPKTGQTQNGGTQTGKTRTGKTRTRKQEKQDR